MPAKIHAALVRQANKLGLTGARWDAYVYGTLAEIKERRKEKRRKKKGKKTKERRKKERRKKKSTSK